MTPREGVLYQPDRAFRVRTGGQEGRFIPQTDELPLDRGDGRGGDGIRGHPDAPPVDGGRLEPGGSVRIEPVVEDLDRNEIGLVPAVELEKDGPVGRLRAEAPES
jgi:hypothetical protein